MTPRVTILFPLLLVVASCGAKPTEQQAAGGAGAAQSPDAAGSAEREHGERAALGE